MKLVAIDLDGTLLLEDGTISEQNVKAIKDVQKQGDVITICSGRSLHDTQNIISRTGINCPVITGNGAVAVYNEQLLHQYVMEEKLTRELIEWLDPRDFYYELYTNKGVMLVNDSKLRLKNELSNEADYCLNWANGQIDIQFAQHGMQFVNHYSDMNISDLDVYKVYVMSFDKAKLQTLYSLLEGRDDLSHTNSGWTKVEIAHKDTNKGVGLQSMASHLQIPLEQTMAIGDNFNDVPMFQIAGTSIAMGNAVSEIQQQCTYVTKSLDDDGVAFALNQYVIGQ